MSHLRTALCIPTSYSPYPAFVYSHLLRWARPAAHTRTQRGLRDHGVGSNGIMRHRHSQVRGSTGALLSVAVGAVVSALCVCSFGCESAARCGWGHPAIQPRQRYLSVAADGFAIRRQGDTANMIILNAVRGRAECRVQVGVTTMALALAGRRLRSYCGSAR